jgi:hypothetical protein
VPASQEHPFYWVEDKTTNKCVAISDKEVVGAVANDALDLKGTRRGAINGLVQNAPGER